MNIRELIELLRRKPQADASKEEQPSSPGPQVIERKGKKYVLYNGHLVDLDTRAWQMRQFWADEGTLRSINAGRVREGKEQYGSLEEARKDSCGVPPWLKNI